MRIIFVNQYSVPPDQAGGTRHFEMAAELVRLGHRTEVVASDLNLFSRDYSRRRGPADLRFVQERIGGVEATWLTAGSYRGNDWRRGVSMLVFGLMAFVYLARSLRRSERPVVVGSSPHLFGALGAWAAARLRRVPFVFEVRDLWPESYVAVAGRSGPEVRVWRWIADLLYRRSDAVVVLAEPNVSRIVARGADPEVVQVIPNGVDLDTFGAGEPARDGLGSESTFTFVYAGAHGAANGLDAVIDACAILQEDQRSDLRVVLLGDGPLKQGLRTRAEGLGLTNLVFRDPVPKSEVPGLLVTADAGLMVLAPVELFSYGVSPNKLFDYLGAGLPVLTNVPGLVADIVDGAGAGLVVAPGDPQALAEGMVALAGDPTEAVAERGRSYLRAHYDRRRLAARYEGVLGSLW